MNCVPSIAPKYELEIKSTTPILIGSVFMILLVLFLIVTDTLNSPLDGYVCLNVSEDDQQTVRDVPIIVRFDISILQCARFPYFTYLKYDFGDGTPPTKYNRLETFRHTIVIGYYIIFKI
jgi:hypothetical protein